MAIAFLVGRILVGIFYMMNGYNHITQADGMAGYAASKGVPAAKLAVIVSGIMLLVAGLLIVVGIFPLIAVILLVLFYVPTSVMMHNFWTIEDPQARQNDMIHFMKNIALLGSALMYLAIVEWPLSLPLF